jgi:hypothetical protein
MLSCRLSLYPLDRQLPPPVLARSSLPLSCDSRDSRPVLKLEIDDVSLRLGPSYSTTTSSRIVIFCVESGKGMILLGPGPDAPEYVDTFASSSPDTKYDIASVKSDSVWIENSSPSSSVYARKKGEAERWKHSETYGFSLTGGRVQVMG